MKPPAESCRHGMILREALNKLCNSLRLSFRATRGTLAGLHDERRPIQESQAPKMGLLFRCVHVLLCA